MANREAKRERKVGVFSFWCTAKITRVSKITEQAIWYIRVIFVWRRRRRSRYAEKQIFRICIVSQCRRLHRHGKSLPQSNCWWFLEDRNCNFLKLLISYHTNFIFFDGNRIALLNYDIAYYFAGGGRQSCSWGNILCP